MSKKPKNVCTTLNYNEHFLILASSITGCVYISAFASLVDIPLGITSSATGLKICPITAGINQENKKEAWQNGIVSKIYKTILLYCLKCRKNTESKNTKFARTKNERVMLLSKRAVCDRKSQNLSNSKKLVDY